MAMVSKLMMFGSCTPELYFEPQQRALFVRWKPFDNFSALLIFDRTRVRRDRCFSGRCTSDLCVLGVYCTAAELLHTYVHTSRMNLARVHPP